MGQDESQEEKAEEGRVQEPIEISDEADLWIDIFERHQAHVTGKKSCRGNIKDIKKSLKRIEIRIQAALVYLN